jgi:hypothetical protein
MKCDFCSSTPVTAAYYAEDFIVASLATVTLGSTGGWAACASCELLIDTGNWAILVERVTETFIDAYPAMRLTDKNVLREHFHNLYRKLMASGFRKRLL